jgi:hypothetical protein
MGEIAGGGRAWWFPVGSEDHVPVTKDVMSYEIDGELRLAESFGFSKIEFGSDPEDDAALP